MNVIPIDQPPRKINQPMRDGIALALLQIAMRDPDPNERAAKVAILREDGWLCQ